MYRQSEKKLVKQQYLLLVFAEYRVLGSLTAEIGSGVWAPLQISTGFTSWQRCSTTLCGVEHGAPPIFGKAAITLGIGPHSSCVNFVF